MENLVIQSVGQCPDFSSRNGILPVPVVNPADGRNNSRCSRGKGLLQLAVIYRGYYFIHRESSFGNLYAPAFGKPEYRVSGNAGENASRKRGSYQLVIDDEEDIACSDFFDVLSFNCIEPENLRISHFFRYFTCIEAGCVISRGLAVADPAGGGTYIFLGDEDLRRAESLGVIGPDGTHDDEKQVLVCRMHP